MHRIIARNVFKKFKIGRKKHQTALARALSFFSGSKPKRTIWALKDISCAAAAGEIIGIIGQNGAGKSTLLRVLAGIYTPDAGCVQTQGNIISLINLFAGLKDRLTMKENIHLCCTLFGLDRNAIKKRFDRIVDFAELHDFIDTKVYQFSNGMIQRLVFSAAFHCNPEIMLLDEVFMVGDELFRKKCHHAIQDVIADGGTVLFVSHDLPIIETCCHKALWLDQGTIVRCGDTKETIEAYRSACEYHDET